MSPQPAYSPKPKSNAALQLLLSGLSFLLPLAVVSGICVAAVLGIAAIEEETEVDLFPRDRVLDVQVTVAQEDWDKIRQEKRGFYEVLHERRKYTPIEHPYTYVKAQLTIDGVDLGEVGIRKKGFIGSQNTSRPSLKIKLDYVDEKGHVNDLTSLTFNNNNQDISLMSQVLGYEFFNKAGSPAPRCACAMVTVNGKKIGLYSHVESVRRPLLKREPTEAHPGFGDDRGTLYEGAVVDFYDGWENSFEKKLGKKRLDSLSREKIKQLIAVLQGESRGETILSDTAMGRGWVPTGDPEAGAGGLVTYAPSTAKTDKVLRELESRIATLRKVLTTPTPELAAAQARWEVDDGGKRVALSPWSMIGPFRAKSFDEAYQQEFPPEKGVDLAKTYDKLKWSKPKGLVDGRPFRLGGEPSAARYFFRVITASRARKLAVSLGSDDSIKLWLNGKLQFENKTQRGVTPDEDKVDLELVAGENQLLIKIINGQGESGFFFRSLQQSLPAPLLEALKVALEKRDEAQRGIVADHFRRITPLLQPIRDKLAAAAREHYGQWTAYEFDDSTWTSGRNGAGYENDSGYESLISKPFDFQPEMHEKNSSVYLRFSFEIEDLDALTSGGDLVLKMKYDDGFVAYLNGHRVASSNAPKSLRWNSRATASHGDDQARQFEPFNITKHKGKFREGHNVLAIHGLNVSPGSTDMLIVAEIQTLQPQNMEQAIGELVDLDAFYRFWAVEGLLGFWDGYTANNNNFFIYHNPTTDKLHFLPWGADCLFEKISKLRVDPRAPVSVKTKGLLAHKLYQIPAARERYARTLKDIMGKHWDEEALLAETQRMETMLKPHVAQLPESQKRRIRFDLIRRFIRNRRGDIEKEIADGMPVWAAVPGPPPQIPDRGGNRPDRGRGKKPGRKVAAKTIWEAAKRGNIAVIKQQLAKGVNVNAKGEGGSTPLSMAALAGQARTVKFLVDRKANVNIRGEDGGTPLHGAAFLGHLAVVRVLLANGADVNARNKENATPLDNAAPEWSEELQGVVGFLADWLQIKIDAKAMRANRPKVAAFLREKGGLHGAQVAAIQNTDFWTAARTGKLGVLKQHLAKDADVNRLDEKGYSALAWAAMAGEAEAVKLLLKQGADVNQKNRDGSVALHGSAFFGQTGVVKLLIEGKADVNARNGQGETALGSVAPEWNDGVKSITQLIAGALQLKVDVEKIREARPRIVEILRQHGGKTGGELK